MQYLVLTRGWVVEEEQRKSRAGAPTPVKEIIDLTDGDDELTQALQASMQTESANPQVSTTFGPSNRAPDPAWAMVPSNVRGDVTTRWLG